jgi:hypothetical protein
MPTQSAALPHCSVSINRNKFEFWNLISLAKGGGQPEGHDVDVTGYCFGAMLAWTPGLVVLAVLLWEEPLDGDDLHPDLS